MPKAKKILIVEDDFYIRDLYERALINTGYITETADDGEMALEKLREFKADLVLLDIMLPRKGGFEVLETIKKDKELSVIPVVLLTNLGQEEAIKKGFSLGAEGYLIKSAYTPAQIVDELKNYLK